MRTPKQEARRIVHEVLREAAKGEGSKAVAAQAELEEREAALRESFAKSFRDVGAAMAAVGLAAQRALAPVATATAAMREGMEAEKKAQADASRHAFLGASQR